MGTRWQFRTRRSAALRQRLQCGPAGTGRRCPVRALGARLRPGAPRQQRRERLRGRGTAAETPALLSPGPGRHLRRFPYIYRKESGKISSTASSMFFLLVQDKNFLMCYRKGQTVPINDREGGASSGVRPDRCVGLVHSRGVIKPKSLLKPCNRKGLSLFFI